MEGKVGLAEVVENRACPPKSGNRRCLTVAERTCESLAIEPAFLNYQDLY